MREPLVSVIVPAFNAEKYIAESINSVLDQTYRHWELIVVNDGSSDRTAEITQAFAESDRRIKYVYQKNQGLAGARNTGIKNSSGELVAFLDADDLWESEKLCLQVQTMIETGADLVFTDGYIFTEGEPPGKLASYPSNLVGCGMMDGRTQMFKHLFTSNGIPVLSVMVRKELLEKVHSFRKGYHGCEDYELWLRLARSGAVFYGMKEKLFRYRRHPNAMSFNRFNMIEKEFLVLSTHAREVLEGSSNQGDSAAFNINERDTESIRARLAQMREWAVAAFFDQYYTAVKAGRLFDALCLLWRGARIAPSQVLHPRWMAETFTRGIVAAVRRKRSGHAES